MKNGRINAAYLTLFGYFIIGVSVVALIFIEPTKKTINAYHDVYYAVHVSDTKGRNPVDYLSRHKLRGGEIVELPTLYQVRYHHNGKVEDIGIAYQPWWKK